MTYQLSTRLYLPRSAELDDYPIVAWTTATFCFPAITHVRGASGHDQVVTMTEEHVAAREYEPAVFSRSKIDLACRLRLSCSQSGITSP